MTFIVARPNGTWEARESFRTEAGPRAKTLASFRDLTPEVEEKIRTRASQPVDLDDLRLKTVRSGAPVGSPADRLAAKLLRAMSQGDRPSNRLRALLEDDFGQDGGLSHELERMKSWTGASSRERGEALVDLLGVGDALPSTRSHDREVRFPRIESGP